MSLRSNCTTPGIDWKGSKPYESATARACHSVAKPAPQVTEWWSPSSVVLRRHTQTKHLLTSWAGRGLCIYWTNSSSFISELKVLEGPGNALHIVIRRSGLSLTMPCSAGGDLLDIPQLRHEEWKETQCRRSCCWGTDTAEILLHS